MEIPRTLGMACYCYRLRETQISGDAAWLQCMAVVYGCGAWLWCVMALVRDSGVWLWRLTREKRTVGFFVVISLFCFVLFLRESVRSR